MIWLDLADFEEVAQPAVAPPVAYSTPEASDTRPAPQAHYCCANEHSSSTSSTAASVMTAR